MAPTIPTGVPSTIVAGDTAIWTRVWSDYPVSDGWTAKLYLRGASVLDVDGAIASDGVSFEFQITPGQSGPLVAGQYQWRHTVALNGANYTTESGILTVEANPYTAKPGDLQSTTEQELALCNRQITELLSSSTESYSVGQRSAQKRALAELTTLRGVLTAKLGRERGQRLPGYAMGFRAPR